MRVRTLNRQLQDLSKHHELDPISVLTLRDWYHTEQVTGARIDHTNQRVVLYIDTLPPLQSFQGMRVFELRAMVGRIPDEYAVVLGWGGTVQDVIAVVNFVQNDRREHVGFMNDSGYSSSALLKDAQYTLCIPVPLNPEWVYAVERVIDRSNDLNENEENDSMDFISVALKQAMGLRP